MEAGDVTALPPSVSNMKTARMIKKIPFHTSCFPVPQNYCPMFQLAMNFSCFDSIISSHPTAVNFTENTPAASSKWDAFVAPMIGAVTPFAHSHANAICCIFTPYLSAS